MAETALDCLLESLNQIRKVEIGCLFSVVEMNQIGCLYEEVEFLRNSLKDLEKNRNEHDEIVKDVLTEIRDVAYEAADIIDLSFVNHISQSCPETDQVPKGTADEEIVLSHVLKQIKSLKEQVMKKFYSLEVPQVGPSFHGSSSSSVSTVLNVEEDTVVGFDDEAEMLKERLTGMSKQLHVISIIGMAGLGKTTLARKLYNDPLILHHFYIRGWTCVSQVYRKRDVLLDILSTIKDQISTESDEKLGEKLYKRLKGNRYLVVIDDMWHIGAWNDLKRYFPNDSNGSRILFTSRCTDVVLHANHVDPPHYLRFLNEDESWHLLQKKIFWKESCPPDLIYIGKHIARKCQGLPLAIAVVAGLLAKTDKNQDWWKQVAKNLSSYIVNDTEKCIDILALSYNSLPHHLKLCFLYFGAFPKDYEISVRKLIWLWITEGFIHRIGHGNKSVEDVAGDYLMDLIDRNLVLVARRKSTGGISACRVHDLLHDLCLRKAKEENFLQQIYEFRNVSSSTSSPLVHIGKQHRRSCVNSCIFCDIFSTPIRKPIAPHIFKQDFSTPIAAIAPHIRSLLSSLPRKNSLLPKSISFIYRSFKLLRVLDLLAFSIPSFPSEIVQLFLLRYLALWGGRDLSIPASIGNLQNLEVFIISQPGGSFIPDKLWNIATLRHLRIGGINHMDGRTITVGSPIILVNLQTISHLCPTRNCQGLLARTLNLRKLGFRGPFWFPDLDFLNHLEKLQLINTYVPDYHRLNLQGVKFPPNLKSLTLSNTSLEWKEMSVLGMLPNLEVLKLKSHACIGSLWETSDGGFRRLKYLRLYFLNVQQRNTSSIHFPSLQHLVLRTCHKLKEIPSELGYIYTLHTIEVRSCSDSVVNSAVEIQKEQKGIGNDSLKIIILNPLPDSYFQVSSGQIINC